MYVAQEARKTATPPMKRKAVQPVTPQRKPVVRTGNAVAKPDAAMAAAKRNETVTKTINSQIPWPAVIMAIVGILALVFVGLLPRLSLTYRIIAIVLTLIWSIIWIIVLWILWRYSQRTVAWILLLLPILSLIGYTLFMGLYYTSK